MEKIKQKELGKIVRVELESKGYKLNNVQSEDITMTIINTILNLALEDKIVCVHGKGEFKSKVVKGRTVKHPKTQEDFTYPDKKIITFETSRRYKKNLNQ